MNKKPTLLSATEDQIIKSCSVKINSTGELARVSCYTSAFPFDFGRNGKSKVLVFWIPADSLLFGAIVPMDIMHKRIDDSPYVLGKYLGQVSEPKFKGD